MSILNVVLELWWTKGWHQRYRLPRPTLTFLNQCSLDITPFNLALTFDAFQIKIYLIVLRVNHHLVIFLSISSSTLLLCFFIFFSYVSSLFLVFIITANLSFIKALPKFFCRYILHPRVIKLQNSWNVIKH